MASDGWISVKERWPGVVDDYLVEIEGFSGVSSYADVLTFSEGRFQGVPCGFRVTHWMPLPEAPDAE